MIKYHANIYGVQGGYEGRINGIYFSRFFLKLTRVKPRGTASIIYNL